MLKNSPKLRSYVRRVFMFNSIDPLLNYLSTAILKSWLQLVKKSSQDTLYIAHFF